MVLVNLSKGKVIRKEVSFARSFLQRAIGLMFRPSFEGALVFPLHGRTSFHSFFCRFPILLLCVKDGVVTCKRVLPPWSLAEVEGDYVVELDARMGADVDVGDRVVILEDSD